MTCLECRDDTLVLTHHFEALQCLVICNCHILCSTAILQEGMFWSNSGIIQTCTYTMSIQSLATLFLNYICQCTLQYSRCALGQSGTVLLILINTMTSSLYSMQFNSLI